MDDPKLLAGRNVNPKVSDVYNLFRISHLGVRTGKKLFTELECRICVYNDVHNGKQFYRGSVKIIKQKGNMKVIMKEMNKH